MPTDQLTQSVRALMSGVADLARELDHPELAERVDVDLERAESAVATVVVVGEKKRGKSSLINAMLGLDGLLPVDADVATSCYLTVQHGTPSRVIVRSRDSPEGLEVGLGDVAEYASVFGNRDPDDEEQVLHEGVQAVEVFVEHPLLARGLTLVDTPGVGGLEAGHTEITLATLRRADALVFVVDPDGPLKAPDLRFLERAAERIATVIFVMTKTDLYPGWARVLDDDKMLVAAHAPRYDGSPWLPVSSQLRQDALAASGRHAAGRAATLLEQSGFPAFEQAIVTDVLARSMVLQHANALHAAQSVLDRLASVFHTRIRSATGDPRLADELDDKQAALTALGEADAGWRGRFSDAFRRLETKLQTELQRRVKRVRRAAEDQVAAWGPQVFESLPRDTEAALSAAWIDINTQIQREVMELCGSVVLGLTVEGIDAEADTTLPEALTSLPEIGRSAEPEHGVVTDYGREAITGLGVGSMLAGALALGPVGLALVGVGIAGALVSTRKDKEQRLQGQRDASRWAQRATEDAALEMSAGLRSALLNVQQQAQAAIGSALADRRSTLEAEIIEHKQRLRLDQSERNRVRIDSEQTLARVAELVGVADELRTELSAASPEREVIR